MPRVRAHLLTIGDELLAGDIVDQHKAWLGQRCRVLGIEVVRATTVRDRETEIIAAIHAAAADADICLVSGGLGPTTDDLTARAAALAAQVPLERDPDLAARLEAFFAPRGDRALVEMNLKQADLPKGAEILDNPVGTAAGFAVEVSDPAVPDPAVPDPAVPDPAARPDQTESGSGCWLFSMPGVPHELHLMMEEQVEPRLRERYKLEPLPRRVYRVVGRGESSLQQLLEPILADARARSPGLANMFVHYRARYPEVQVILEATPAQNQSPDPNPDPNPDPTPPGDSGRGASAQELASLDDPIREVVGGALYAIAPGDGPPDIATSLVAAMRARGLSLATAESCTGGGIGAAITAVAGSSAIFYGGVVAYANSAKRDLLSVPAESIETHGAVSEPVARAMAEGARAAFGSDLAVSTTGIAGPEGGSEDKPVGTVDIAVAGPKGTTYRRFKLFGRRESVRRAATQWALKLVWDQLDQL